MYILKKIVTYLLLIFFLIALYNYITKKNLRSTITKTIVSVTIVLFACFFSLNTFVYFSTPEEAYSYNYKGKIEKVVEGQQTALVIAYDNRDKSTVIVTNSMGKWKAGAGYKTKIVYQSFEDDIGVVVLNHNNSKDYYVLISCLNDKIYNVEDSMNSSFTFYDDDRSCCTVIEDYDEFYSVKITQKDGSFALF